MPSVIVVGMSPTVFREGSFRFFFSREEERLHIHVQSPDGEAKYLSRVLQLVIDHEQEIRDAWQHHFDR